MQEAVAGALTRVSVSLGGASMPLFLYTCVKEQGEEQGEEKEDWERERKRKKKLKSWFLFLFVTAEHLISDHFATKTCGMPFWLFPVFWIKILDKGNFWQNNEHHFSSVHFFLPMKISQRENIPKKLEIKFPNRNLLIFPFSTLFFLYFYYNRTFRNKCLHPHTPFSQKDFKQLLIFFQPFHFELTRNNYIYPEGTLPCKQI